jgi:hypothetical protein
VNDVLVEAVLISFRTLLQCVVFAVLFGLLRAVDVDETWALGLSIVVALGGRSWVRAEDCQ